MRLQAVHSRYSIFGMWASRKGYFGSVWGRNFRRGWSFRGSFPFRFNKCAAITKTLWHKTEFHFPLISGSFRSRNRFEILHERPHAAARLTPVKVFVGGVVAVFRQAETEEDDRNLQQSVHGDDSPY